VSSNAATPHAARAVMRRSDVRGHTFTPPPLQLVLLLPSLLMMLLYIGNLVIKN